MTARERREREREREKRQACGEKESKRMSKRGRTSATDEDVEEKSQR